MPPSLGETYRAGHRRVDAYVRDLLTDGRSTADPVPACPGWTVHGVVSHLAANATDALARRLNGIPDDAFTANQVAERADRTTAEVLDEWAPQVDAFAAVVDRFGLFPPAADLVTHEGDIREALGDAPPPEDGWRDLLRAAVRQRISDLDGPGSLTVTSDGETWTGGSGGDGPSAAVEVPPWELFRGLMSRRSGAQMRAWHWDGDPDPWVERLPVFGVRGDDQPTSAGGR